MRRDVATKVARPPRAGQVWMDNDSRIEERVVLVERVDSTYAYITVLKSLHSPRTVGRGYRVLLNRMRPTSTGYYLLRDEFGNCPKCERRKPYHYDFCSMRGIY